MSENLNFETHYPKNRYPKNAPDLVAGLWGSVMLALSKSLHVIPHLDYGSHLWTPFKVTTFVPFHIIEKVHRVFTKHKDCVKNLSYAGKLST